jgi:branched-chain amino acid transport system ATP-binding protein
MNSENRILLDVEHLTMRFGGLVAVSDLSFRVGQGEITALIGPNGAGKTTVFNCLTGFYRPRVGRLQLNVNARLPFLLERMEAFRIAREARVIRTFQNVRLFARMSVFENLLVAQHAALTDVSVVSSLLALPSYGKAARKAVERARYWLDKMDLTSAANDMAGNLPYGPQRKLEIARAMCAEPRLLCLDEPAAGLNPRESEVLNRLLLEIRREHGISVLLIEHDMRVVMRISDHVVVLDHGVAIADGTTESVRRDPAVIRAYLGASEAEAVVPARGPA